MLCKFAAWAVSVMTVSQAVSPQAKPGALLCLLPPLSTAGKDVRFGVEGRAQMLLGVDKLADAVQVGVINTIESFSR